MNLPNTMFLRIASVIGACLSAGCELGSIFQPSAAEVLQAKGKQCLDFHKSALKDPYSAIIDRTSQKPGNPNEIVVSYHAKNSFGAYMPGELRCYFHGESINTSMTQSVNILANMRNEVESMKAFNDCMFESNDRLSRGEEGLDCRKE